MFVYAVSSVAILAQRLLRESSEVLTTSSWLRCVEKDSQPSMRCARTKKTDHVSCPLLLDTTSTQTRRNLDAACTTQRSLDATSTQASTHPRRELDLTPLAHAKACLDADSTSTTPGYDLNCTFFATNYEPRLCFNATTKNHKHLEEMQFCHARHEILRRVLVQAPGKNPPEVAPNVLFTRILGAGACNLWFC